MDNSKVSCTFDGYNRVKKKIKQHVLAKYKVDPLQRVARYRLFILQLLVYPYRRLQIIMGHHRKPWKIKAEYIKEIFHRSRPFDDDFIVKFLVGKIHPETKDWCWTKQNKNYKCKDNILERYPEVYGFFCFFLKYLVWWFLYYNRLKEKIGNIQILWILGPIVFNSPSVPTGLS